MDSAERFQIPAHVIWRDFPGELALFDSCTGRHHVLNDTAADIWRSLATGNSVEEIAVCLGHLYDAAPNSLLMDIAEFIAEMCGLGLLVRAGAD